MDTEVINLSEAARRLEVSVPTVLRWANRGKLPTISVGGYRFVRTRDLDGVEPRDPKGRKRATPTQVPDHLLKIGN
jgi:excisionase family DNA binding protein